MLKKNAKITHLIYGIIVSVMVVALGIALILSCLDIYRANPDGDPYSPATISAHFQEIAILVYSTFAVILGGILLDLFTTRQKEKTRPVRDQRTQMLKAASKAGIPSPEQQNLLNKENRLRIIITLGSVLLFVGLMIYPLIHVASIHDYNNPSPNGEIIKSTLIILAPAVLGFAVCTIGAILVSKSYQRQTTIYKSIKNNGQKPVVEEKTASKMPLRIIRCTIFIAAIAFIILGITNGSARDVWKKAVAICTECIGLG